MSITKAAHPSKCKTALLYFKYPVNLLFQNYCKAHPNMVVIDPLDNVRQILDRYEQYKLVEQSQMLEDGQWHL